MTSLEFPSFSNKIICSMLAAGDLAVGVGGFFFSLGFGYLGVFVCLFWGVVWGGFFLNQICCSEVHCLR